MPDVKANVKALLEDLLLLQAKLTNKTDKTKLGIIIGSMMSGSISLKSVIKMVQNQIDGTRHPNAKNPTRRKTQTKTWELVREIFKKHLDLARDM